MAPKAKNNGPTRSEGMAPKAKNNGYVTEGEVELSLDDVSLADDSGWRVVNEEFVNNLVDDWTERGTYGHTVFEAPSVLLRSDTEQGQFLLSSTAGKIRINNGQRKVAALVKCATIFKGSPEPPAWATGDLLHIMETNKLRFEKVRYSEVPCHCLEHIGARQGIQFEDQLQLHR